MLKESSFDSEGSEGISLRLSLRNWAATQRENFLGTERRPQFPWIISTLFFAVLSLALGITCVMISQRGNTYEKGFLTDFILGDETNTLQAPATKLIEMVEVQFGAALLFDDNGTLIREHMEGQTDWVGSPSPEIDALWDPLALDASGIYVDGEDADTVRGKTKWIDGYWITGLDVFHQIHCLNKLRKALYPDYYFDPDPPHVQLLHVEHCIDYLRQAILCSADMTEVHVLWFESAQRYAPDFKTVHTCRNIQPLIDWSLARSRRDNSGTEEEITPHHVPKGSGV
ncbi:hypothetical protein BP6252_13331 [Coleophoma cylindrospora]|uniref:Tat pathway signal sequence n=1 Tax=Coleophoma cylindrospora TaxID=1849047 RepID=A0A3D8QAI6_9HELO|nr:hypothetical protein BP6252_13331 [Coleophoma cylindrospora]